MSKWFSCSSLTCIRTKKKISFGQLKKQSILIIKIRKMLRLRNGTFCLKIFCFQLLFSLRSASNDYLFVVSSTVLSLSIDHREAIHDLQNYTCCEMPMDFLVAHFKDISFVYNYFCFQELLYYIFSFMHPGWSPAMS